ncbi:CotH kinase family protein [Taibaiella sp. KBW10]|uniref:CotH kinase family protein n=1 Tax=Taibaiella sp. KBW10 TaxID=2153357 RepID=UPI00131589BF|nr:CotH kinase family protein [Taibaiella sp. KBW10]
MNFYSYKHYIILFSILAFFFPKKSVQAQSIFEATKLHEIHIAIPTAQWFDTLQQYYDEGLNGSDKKVLPARIVIDGHKLAHDIAIRFKGQYSNYGFPGKKKPFRLHFGKFNSDQDYEGIKKINLHNLAGDPSFLREFVAYDFLNTIGLPASRTAFTRLYINNTYFGCYLIVEEPEDKVFLNRHFQNDKGNLFDAKDNTELKWVNNQAASYPELGLQTKEKNDSWDALIHWLDLFNNYHAFDFQQQFSASFHTSSYLKTLSADVLMDNWDSYAANSRNFFLYDNSPNHQIHWIPWDYNLSFWYKNLSPFPKKSDGSYRPLIARIVNTPYLKNAYFKTLCQLLDQDAAVYPIAAKTTAAFNLIKEAVIADSFKFYSNDDFFRNRDNEVIVKMLRSNVLKEVALPGVVPYFEQRRLRLRKELLQYGCDCDQINKKKGTSYTQVYPNPVTSVLHIYTEDPITSIDISIYNAIGLTMRHTSLVLSQGKGTVDIQTLPAGIYFITLHTDTAPETIRFIKQ